MMADKKDFVELAELASNAIKEVERLQKSAAIDAQRLDQLSHTLVDCGIIKSEQRDTFIKTASDDPNTLLTAIETMAKHAKVVSAVPAGSVGTVVKGAEGMYSDDDPNRAYRALYRSR